MPLASGTKLGEYEVISLVGAGGMGEVYRARDPVLKRYVAIKVLPESFSRDAERSRRFQQEAQAAAALNHPNILAVHQLGALDGSFYLVSELLEGDTLRHLLSSGAIPMREAIDYAVQMAHGLAAAHEHGIVHRDLKPENVFVTRDGRVKILDFGLAKLKEPILASSDARTVTVATEPGVVMGTVGYMSPEQVRGEGADQRSDIFSLGLVLYEMLTGARAFRKPTSAETMAAVLHEDPADVSQGAPNLPPALSRVVRHCLEKNPAQRFRSASDLAFALEALSDSGTGISAVTSPSKKRAPWKWIMIGAVGCASVAALLVWWTAPPMSPVVEDIVQLTSDGQPKSGTVVTDGSRVYFNEGRTGTVKIAEVSVAGGATGTIGIGLPDPMIASITPDASSLLVVPALLVPSSVRVDSLWAVPVPAGDPRRLMEEGGFGAATYMPDGRILSSQGSKLVLAENDGSNPRPMGSLDQAIGDLSVSPDGKRIAFTNISENFRPTVSQSTVEGQNAHRLVNPGSGDESCCAVWMPDGNGLIEQSIHGISGDLWWVPVNQSRFRRSANPVRLTNSQLSWSSTDLPGISRDGRQVYAIGDKNRGELVRYDLKSKAYVPYLSGISATNPTFSTDGQWVAWLSYPDDTLWRSRIDGSERQQLTRLPLQPISPFISPDGQQVAFSIKNEVWIAAIDGTPPRKIIDSAGLANWSPDGNRLVFLAVPRQQHAEIRTYDVHTGTIATIPSSQDLLGPLWIDRDRIMASTEHWGELRMFDFRTGKWSAFMSIPKLVGGMKSPDGKYIYEMTGGSDPELLRIRTADHKVETIISLKDFHQAIDPSGLMALVAVAPDQSPVLTRDVGTHEIYAIKLRWR